jgi:hypothetical protein
MAQAIVNANGQPIQSILISSDGLGEGAFVAEVAQRDARPGRFILRSSKILAQATWMGQRHYQFDTQDQLKQLLEDVPLQLVVLDRARLPHDAHEELLFETLTASPDTWMEWRSPDFGQLRVFRRRDSQGPLGPQDEARIEALQQPN